MPDCTCQQPVPPDPDLIEARRRVAVGKSAVLETAINLGAWDRGELIKAALIDVKRGRSDDAV